MAHRNQIRVRELSDGRVLISKETWQANERGGWDSLELAYMRRDGTWFTWNKSFDLIDSDAYHTVL